MKKFLLKTILTPFSVTTAVMIGVTFTTRSICDQQINNGTCVQQTYETVDEATLTLHINKIEHAIQDAQNWFNNFFDAKNKESYKLHVEKFQNKLHAIETTILKPLDSALSNTAHTATNAYLQIAQEVHYITHEVYNCLQNIYCVFDSNRGKPVVVLKNALLSMQNTLAQELICIGGKLQQLQALCQAKGVQFEKNIASLQNKLQTLINHKANPLELLNGLLVRVKC